MPPAATSTLATTASRPGTETSALVTMVRVSAEGCATTTAASATSTPPATRLFRCMVMSRSCCGAHRLLRTQHACLLPGGDARHVVLQVEHADEEGEGAGQPQADRL